jgi:hypothetical protein
MLVIEVGVKFRNVKCANIFDQDCSLRIKLLSTKTSAISKRQCCHTNDMQLPNFCDNIQTLLVLFYISKILFVFLQVIIIQKYGSTVNREFSIFLKLYRATLRQKCKCLRLKQSMQAKLQPLLHGLFI